jgi:hypothetical protein
MISENIIEEEESPNVDIDMEEEGAQSIRTSSQHHNLSSRKSARTVTIDPDTKEMVNFSLKQSQNKLNALIEALKG